MARDGSITLGKIEHRIKYHEEQLKKAKKDKEEFITKREAGSLKRVRKMAGGVSQLVDEYNKLSNGALRQECNDLGLDYDSFESIDDIIRACVDARLKANA